MKSTYQHPECCDTKMTLRENDPKGGRLNRNRRTSAVTGPVPTFTTVLLAPLTTLTPEFLPGYPLSLSSMHPSHILRVPLFLVQSSKESIQTWRDRVPALEGHGESVDACVRNEGNGKAAPFSTFTFLHPLQPFLSGFPM